jgi:uncharacterized protein YggT (Ycf19 family)
MMNPILQYWYFHIPNFLLAAVMYTVLGRIILSLFAPPDWQNYIWRAFTRITDPFVNATRAVTPAAVHEIVLLIFTFLWLMLARVAFFAWLGSRGLLPTVGA